MRIKIVQYLIDKIRGKKIPKPYIKSYSQCGEDVIIRNLVGEKPINYLDIGAHHSCIFSNTKLFYDLGSRGVLVEPDPTLFKEISKNRKHDICLNIAIGEEENNAIKFYIFEPSYLNTTKKDSIEYLTKQEGVKYIKSIDVKMESINNILNKYFKTGLDFLSIDTEGFDYEILSSIDFNNIRPKIICAETLNFADKQNQHKEYEIIDFLISKNYFVYADTRLNTIFVDNEYWVSLV